MPRINQFPKRTFAISVLIAGFAAASPLQAEAPYVDPANDAKHFAEPSNILFWTPEQKVAGFRNSDRISPTREVAASENPRPLPRNETELDEVLIRYRSEGKPLSMTVDDYFRKQNVAGLLVIKDGAIAYERYGLGNSETSRWNSFSVAKSLVSMLVGAAIKDGYISSLDDPVTRYLPRMKGSAYDQVSIRNLLHMASGVEWNEDYADPDSDINANQWQTLTMENFLASKPRVHEPGDQFNYNTAESNLVGNLLRSAVGNNLSSYLSAKIWKPFGMEYDAAWSLTGPDGGEWGGCCINATLRDYGRLGLFAMSNGRLDENSQVLPDGWMEESTTPSPTQPGYGYLWWLIGDGTYRASGIFGQGIYINPEKNTVIALHSAREVASQRSDTLLQTAMFQAITRHLDYQERLQ